MTLSEFVRFYSESQGVTLTQARKEIDNFIAAFKKATYSNGAVSIRGFIQSQVVDVPAREAKDPRTGEPIKVDAKSVVKVKAQKSFKNMED